MAKFNGIKEGDLLFNSKNLDFTVLLMFLIGIIGLYDFISGFFSVNPLGVWFFIRGILSITLIILFGIMSYQMLFQEEYRYEGYYLGDRILFKYSFSKLISTNKVVLEKTESFQDIDHFINGKGLTVDVLFFNSDRKSILGLENYILLSKPYQKHKVEVIDFLNKRVKEFRK
jgi:hypothetical protein